MVEDKQVHEILINAPADQVWKLVTTPENLKEWYAFDGATVDLRQDGEITFQWDEHGKYYGVIEKIEAEKQFAFRYAPFQADVKPSGSNSLLVTIVLEPQDNRTKLQLIEEGYSNLDLSDTEKKENFETNQGAWDNSLSLLKEKAEIHS